MEEKQDIETHKSRQTEARNIRDIQPLYLPIFFFFLYTSLEKRRVEKNGENF